MKSARLFALTMGLLLPFARPLLAQPTDQDAAVALFQEAKTLMAAGDYATACPKLALSQKLSPALGTLLNLARCHEGEGKTASAWAGYREVAVFAEKAGQTERANVARERAAALEKTLSRMRIEIQSATPGLTVMRNHIPVEEALLGTAIAVDPGAHLIEATAPGHRTWSSEVTVGASSDLQIVRIPALEKGEPPPPATATATASAAPSAAPTAKPETSSYRTAGFVIGGTGAALLIAGAAIGGWVASEAGRLHNDPALCPQKLCSDEGYAQLQTATTFGWVSTAALGAGAAALGAGILLVILSPGRPSPQGKQGPSAALRAGLVTSPSGAALRFWGSF